MGQALVGRALMGRALGPLGPYGPGPYPPWAIMGSPVPFWAGPLWAPLGPSPDFT